jgi:NAD(P)-dependent dehydrogenase (short-subunit alcohol dehydrogenase family)
MRLGLDGAAVVITGAGSGIGLACAHTFAGEGASVGLIDRDAAVLEVAAALASQGGTAALSTIADVTSETKMTSAVGTLAQGLGGLDVLVCCAGISGTVGASVSDVSLDEWNRVLAVNVTGQFLAVKHSLPFLRQARNPAIVLMGSDSGFVAAPGMVPYNASKGAVVQLVRALSVDLAPDGIRVNCVCPSIVDTPMARSDLGIESDGFATVGYPVQSAAEVAAHVLYLGSPVSRPINGTALISDFGYLARSSFPA